MTKNCLKTIFSSLQVAHDVKVRLNQIPDYEKKLLMVRRQLMGTSNSIRRYVIHQATTPHACSNRLCPISTVVVVKFSYL